MRSLERKDPEEDVIAVFRYTGLGEGETIESAIVTVEVHKGVDPAPENLKSGSPAVSGNEVRQLIVGGLPDVVYKLRCLATTSEGQTLSNVPLLPVKAY